MADKRPFKALKGFDAHGENVINVAYPREGEGQDAVNTDYFIDENTVQQYDSSRGYDQNFIIDRNDRLYKANTTINAPAGAFNASLWTAVRTDTLWLRVTGGTVQTQDGRRYLIRAASAEITFELPENPQTGATVLFRDEDSNLATIRTRITSAINIAGFGNELLVTRRLGRYELTYNGTEWIPNIQAMPISRVRSSGTIQSTAGDNIFGRTSTGSFTIQLPRYAVDGDTVRIYDTDGLNPVNGTMIRTHPESLHNLIETGQTELQSNLSGWAGFIYRSATSTWHSFVSDIRTRIRPTTSSVQALPLEHIAVRHTSPTANILVTLPEGANDGDYVDVTNMYSFLGALTRVEIAEGSGHLIRGNPLEFIKTKFSQIPDANSNPTSTEVSLPTDYSSPTIRFSYREVSGEWVIDILSYRVERADETNRSRPGIMPLAEQSEVDKNHEDNPADDSALTPKTFSNSTATETRRGISRTATANELQVATDGIHLNDVTVTPRRLNERQATTTIRGLAEVATDVEARDNNNDTHILTPRRLDARRATESLAGVLPLTSNAQVDAGANDTNAVTAAKLLRWTRTSPNAQSTESNRGFVTTASNAQSWVGNTVDGSTQSVGGYTHAGLTITPRTLNFALQNYLPKEAKAVDSDLLDGIDSLQFTRRDISQTIDANWTFNSGRELVFPDGTGANPYSLRRAATGLNLVSSGSQFRIGKSNTESNLVINPTGSTDLGHNGVKKAETTSTGFSVIGNLQVSEGISSGTITQNGSTLQDTYVNRSGDTMSGDLEIIKAAALVNVRSNSTAPPAYRLTRQGGSGSRLIDDGEFKIQTGDGTLWNTRARVTTNGNIFAENGVGVGTTTVIENDAKIDWNKLKSVPDSSTTQKGIVQLNNTLDSNSQTQAATANVARILQEQIDEKAGIEGTTFNNVMVEEYIQIGNLRIQPNPETKEVEYIWVEE